MFDRVDAFAILTSAVAVAAAACIFLMARESRANKITAAIRPTIEL